MQKTLLPDANLFGYTTCDQTGELVKLNQAVVVTKHFGRSTEQLHFKDEAAANEFYLERLRGEEL